MGADWRMRLYILAKIVWRNSKMAKVTNRDERHIENRIFGIAIDDTGKSGSLIETRVFDANVAHRHPPISLTSGKEERESSDIPTNHTQVCQNSTFVLWSERRNCSLCRFDAAAALAADRSKWHTKSTQTRGEFCSECLFNIDSKERKQDNEPHTFN